MDSHPTCSGTRPWVTVFVCDAALGRTTRSGLDRSHFQRIATGDRPIGSVTATEASGVISPAVTFKKTSHFVSGDRTRRLRGGEEMGHDMLLSLTRESLSSLVFFNRDLCGELRREPHTRATRVNGVQGRVWVMSQLRPCCLAW